jgi:hypothetical protein
LPVRDDAATTPARRLAALIEPIAGQVYFSPECHARYEALGFGPSSGMAGKVALPNGPAYFTSRGSLLGQVPGEVVASAFAVFNPAAVVPSVTFGWSITDAPTICAARDAGAIGQLERILGQAPEGIHHANELVTAMTEALRPEGRPLFAGLSSLGFPDSPIGRLWRATDLLREYRGDSHTAAWISAGLDAVEVGLLSELWWGLPLKSYIRTRAWSEEELDAGIERLSARGLLDDLGTGFSEAGRALRATVEDRTDAQMARAVAVLGDDAGELFALLAPWGDAVRAAGGYLAAGAGDLARRP